MIDMRGQADGPYGRAHPPILSIADEYRASLFSSFDYKCSRKDENTPVHRRATAIQHCLYQMLDHNCLSNEQN